MGPGMTVDLIRDEQRRPRVAANAEKLPFADGMFDLYISDPPYSRADSKKYGCPPYRAKRAMGEAWRVLRTGGYYCLLNTKYPSFSPRAALNKLRA
jgi:ubiquinone/menaquinone biosynthesis C-methylase UbiE